MPLPKTLAPGVNHSPGAAGLGLLGLLMFSYCVTTEVALVQRLGLAAPMAVTRNQYRVPLDRPVTDPARASSTHPRLNPGGRLQFVQFVSSPYESLPVPIPVLYETEKRV